MNCLLCLTILGWLPASSFICIYKYSVEISSLALLCLLLLHNLDYAFAFDDVYNCNYIRLSHYFDAKCDRARFQYHRLREEQYPGFESQARMDPFTRRKRNIGYPL